MSVTLHKKSLTEVESQLKNYKQASIAFQQNSLKSSIHHDTVKTNNSNCESNYNTKYKLTTTNFNYISQSRLRPYYILGIIFFVVVLFCLNSTVIGTFQVVLITIVLSWHGMTQYLSEKNRLSPTNSPTESKKKNKFSYGCWLKSLLYTTYLSRYFFWDASDSVDNGSDTSSTQDNLKEVGDGDSWIADSLKDDNSHASCLNECFPSRISKSFEIRTQLLFPEERGEDFLCDGCMNQTKSQFCSDHENSISYDAQGTHSLLSSPHYVYISAPSASEIPSPSKLSINHCSNNDSRETACSATFLLCSQTSDLDPNQTQVFETAQSASSDMLHKEVPIPPTSTTNDTNYPYIEENDIQETVHTHKEGIMSTLTNTRGDSDIQLTEKQSLPDNFTRNQHNLYKTKASTPLLPSCPPGLLSINSPTSVSSFVSLLESQRTSSDSLNDSIYSSIQQAKYIESLSGSNSINKPIPSCLSPIHKFIYDASHSSSPTNPPSVEDPLPLMCQVVEKEMTPSQLIKTLPSSKSRPSISNHSMSSLSYLDQLQNDQTRFLLETASKELHDFIYSPEKLNSTSDTPSYEFSLFNRTYDTLSFNSDLEEHIQHIQNISQNIFDFFFIRDSIDFCISNILHDRHPIWKHIKSCQKILEAMPVSSNPTLDWPIISKALNILYHLLFRIVFFFYYIQYNMAFIPDHQKKNIPTNHYQMPSIQKVFSQHHHHIIYPSNILLNQIETYTHISMEKYPNLKYICHTIDAIYKISVNSEFQDLIDCDFIFKIIEIYALFNFNKALQILTYTFDTLLRKNPKVCVNRSLQVFGFIVTYSPDFNQLKNTCLLKRNNNHPLIQIFQKFFVPFFYNSVKDFKDNQNKSSPSQDTISTTPYENQFGSELSNDKNDEVDIFDSNELYTTEKFSDEIIPNILPGQCLQPNQAIQDYFISPMLSESSEFNNCIKNIYNLQALQVMSNMLFLMEALMENYTYFISKPMYYCLFKHFVDHQSTLGISTLFRYAFKSKILDIDLFNQIIKSYLLLKPTQFPSAYELYKCTKGIPVLEYNKLTFTLLTLSAAQLKLLNVLWEFFNDFRHYKIKLDNSVISVLIKQINTEHLFPQDKKNLFDLIETIQVFDDVCLYSTVINTCIRLNDINHLAYFLSLYENRELSMKQKTRIQGDSRSSHKFTLFLLTPSAQLYASLIKGYGKLNDIPAVWKLWNEMIYVESIYPTDYTFGCMLNTLISSGYIREALNLYYKALNAFDLSVCRQDTTYEQHHLSHMPGNFNSPNCSTQILPTAHFPKETQLNHTKSSSDMIQTQDILNRSSTAITRHNGFKNSKFVLNSVIYSILIRGCAKSKLLNEAMSLYEDMNHFKIECNEVLFNTLIYTCISVNDINKALLIFKDMKQKNCNPDVITYSTLIKGLCNMGQMKEAQLLFDYTRHHNGLNLDNVIYNILLEGYSKHTDVATTEKFFQTMLTDQIIPSPFTLTILIQLYSRNFQFENILKLVELFPKEYHVKFDIYVYTSLITASLINKRIDKAIYFFNQMSFSPCKHQITTRMYGTIIVGCIKFMKVIHAYKFIYDALVSKQFILNYNVLNQFHSILMKVYNNPSILTRNYNPILSSSEKKNFYSKQRLSELPTIPTENNQILEKYSSHIMPIDSHVLNVFKLMIPDILYHFDLLIKLPYNKKNKAKALKNVYLPKLPNWTL